MGRIKKTWTNICRREDFPLIVLALAWFVLHLLMPCSNDDNVLRQGYIGLSLKEHWDLIVNDYFHWSSRVIVNAAIHFLLGWNLLIWKVLDSLLVFGILKALSVALKTKGNQNENAVLASLFLMMPLAYIGESGWLVCSVTYLWPIALGTLSFVTVYKTANGIHVKFWEYLLCALALLFAANQEQMSAMLLTVNGLVFLYFLFKKRMRVIYVLHCILSAGSLLFVMTAPGNTARAGVEEGIRFPDWNMLGLFDKIDLGYSTTMQKLLTGAGSVLVPLLAVFVFVAVWKKYEDRLYRAIAAVPLGYFLIFGLFRNQFAAVFEYLPVAMQGVGRYGSINAGNVFRMDGMVEIFLYSLVGLCLLLCVYLLTEDALKGIAFMLAILAAVAVRMVLAFSPTVFASGARTYLVTYYVFMLTAALMYKETAKQLRGGTVRYMNMGIYGLAGLSVLNLLVSTRL